MGFMRILIRCVLYLLGTSWVLAAHAASPETVRNGPETDALGREKNMETYLQKVDAVILYCAINYQIFWKALRMEIQSGFVYLYEFPWPLTRTFGGIQYSVQGSHINSCYYRHRDYFQYIISQDVDEYFYSETYPYDLFRAAQHAYSIYPNNSVLIVSELRSI